MKYIKYILSVAAVSMCAVTLSGQTPHSGYFLENMPGRHVLNPAFDNEYNYVNLPIVPGFSGIAVGMNGNVGLDHFLLRIITIWRLMCRTTFFPWDLKSGMVITLSA